MTKHVMEKHPDVAKKMEKMHNEDPKKWGREMKPKWAAAPETESANWYSREFPSRQSICQHNES